MQKISHSWAQIKKNAKCQLGRFCPEPFNWSKTWSDFPFKPLWPWSTDHECGRCFGFIVLTKCSLHIFINSEILPSSITFLTTSDPWDTNFAFSFWVSIVAACKIISGVKAEGLKCSCRISKCSLRLSSWIFLPAWINFFAADLTLVSFGSLERWETGALPKTTKQTKTDFNL